MTKKKGETSYKETAFGIIPRSKLIPLEIQGTKKIWDFIISRNKSGRIPITTSFIKKIHEIGFKWIFPEIGGKFRNIDVKVSMHNPPNHYLVPALMKNFIEDIKMRIKYLGTLDDPIFIENLINFLSWAHHRFLWIHPFVDYNGRIGRMLTNIILLNLNLPPIELKVETPKGREKYVQALQKADGGDYRDLEKLFKVAIEEAAKELKNS